MTNATINQLRVLQKADEALYGYFGKKFQKHVERVGAAKIAEFNNRLNAKKNDIEEDCKLKAKKDKKTHLVKFKSM